MSPNLKKIVWGIALLAVVIVSVQFGSRETSAGWVAQSGSGTSGSWRSIASSETGGFLVAVSNSNDYIVTSNGGEIWDVRTNPGARTWTAVASDQTGANLVAVPENDNIYTSSDYGSTWTERTNSGTRYWSSVASSGNGSRILAGTTDFEGVDYLYTSSDYGSTWIARTDAGTSDWHSVTSSVSGQNLAAVANSNDYIVTSSDYGSTWTEQVSAGQRDWRAIASSADGTKLAAVVYNGCIYTSSNSGQSWTQRCGAGSRQWSSIASSADGTRLAAVPAFGHIYLSSDSGATWTAHTNPGENPWTSITSSADGLKLAAVNTGGYITTFTADVTRPTITSVGSSKVNGTYGVGEVIDIRVNFPEPVTSTGSVTVTLETGATDRTCTFTISNSSLGTCNYTVQAGDTSADLTVASISGTITDFEGNVMNNFTPESNLAANKALVIDTTAPTISITAPTDGATVSGASVSLTASASDTNAIAGVQFKRATNTNIGSEDTTSSYGVTWDTTAIADGVQSLIAVARDAAGNYATSSAISVTVANDVTAPTITLLSPLDGATDVAIDTNLTIEFSETVDRESGNIVIYDASDDTAVATIPVTDGQVTGTGTDTITINPTADLEEGTVYYVQIAATAFDDPTGNSYAGITNTTSWNFTTVAAANNGSSGGGGSSSSDIDVSCDVSDTTPAVGDDVSFEVDIDNADDYTFSWTAVLEGDDETTTRTFDTPGKYYPRGLLRTDDGNITVNCGTVTVSTDGGDTDEDEETISDDITTNTDTQLRTIINTHRTLLLELLTWGVELPQTIRDILTDIITDETSQNSITTDITGGTTFDINLELGQDHPDVLRLQQFLNANGFTIATDGPGSPGNETTYFGEGTLNALIRFQNAYNITPAVGFFGPVTRAFVESL